MSTGVVAKGEEIGRKATTAICGGVWGSTIISKVHVGISVRSVLATSSYRYLDLTFRVRRGPEDAVHHQDDFRSERQSKHRPSGGNNFASPSLNHTESKSSSEPDRRTNLCVDINQFVPPLQMHFSSGYAVRVWGSIAHFGVALKMACACQMVYYCRTVEIEGWSLLLSRCLSFQTIQILLISRQNPPQARPWHHGHRSPRVVTFEISPSLKTPISPGRNIPSRCKYS